MTVSLAIGPHTMTVEGDLVEIRFVGEVDRQASVEIHEQLERVLVANAGAAFILADISRLAGLHPEARRNMAEWNRTHKVTAAAVFGGSFAVRTIVTLALRAIKIMNRDQLDSVFTRDEAEARRWLAEARAKRRAPRMG